MTDSNMAAPLLAKTFGTWLFAVISAVAFTTVLGTVSGLIVAAAGAVVHDLLGVLLKTPLEDHSKVRVAKIASVFVGLGAMALGIVFERMNVNFFGGLGFQRGGVGQPPFARDGAVLEGDHEARGDRRHSGRHVFVAGMDPGERRYIRGHLRTAGGSRSRPVQSTGHRDDTAGIRRACGGVVADAAKVGGLNGKRENPRRDVEFRRDANTSAVPRLC